MPKRSNGFQRLIRRIYSSIKPKGATLTESALLKDSDADTEREVDVLIELQVADAVVRIGIECRDHARAADVQWIDLVIGKYQRLPVDRIIAVSRSGFTKGASGKAKANRIETRTLREALDIDWPAELLQVRIGRFAPILALTSTEIICEPQWSDTVPPVTVFVEDREQSPDTFMQSLVARLHGPLWSLLQSEIGKTLEVMTDFDKTLKTRFDVALANTVFVDVSGKSHRVTKMRLRCDLTFEHELLPARQHLLGSVGVTTITDSKAVPEPITVMIAQAPGEPLGRPIMFTVATDEDVETGEHVSRLPRTTENRG